jgi:GNAT superfamily N-acetyltransferase
VVSLRAALPADRAFLREVYGSTRAEELAPVPWTDDQKRGFLDQQFDAQDTEYRRRYPRARLDVILVDGEPAGRLYVDRRPDAVHILDIALLPVFRSRGVGTGLLEELAGEAAAAGKRLTIYMEKFNPARALYARLGFQEVADEGVYVFMVREPPGGSVQAG